MPIQGQNLGINNNYRDRQEFDRNDNSLPDIKDFYIRGKDNPKYSEKQFLETNPIEVIIQKLEMLLLTNKGEVIGNPDFGANLEYKLWQTNLSSDLIEEDIIREINRYIPELNTLGYILNTYIFEGNFRDILYLDFYILGKNYMYLWA